MSNLMMVYEKAETCRWD